MRGIHQWPVNCPHKGQWRGALVFSLICAWINGWVNSGEAGWWFETPPCQLWCHCNVDRDRAEHLRDDIPDKVITSVSRCSVSRNTKPIICNGKMKSYVICLTNNQFHKWKSDKSRHCRPRKLWQWNFNKCFVLTNKIKFCKQLIGLRCSSLIRICAIRCKLTVAEASSLFKGRRSILLDVGL